MDIFKVGLISVFALGSVETQTANVSTTSPLPSTTETPTALQIVTKPDVVWLGLTKSLTVDCVLSDPATWGYSKLVSLVLSRRSLSDLSNDLQELVSVNAFYPDAINVIKPTRGFVSANINETGQSHLGIFWTYPAEEDSGYYECEATLLSEAMHPVKLRASRTVNHSVPSLLSLVDHFRLLEMELDSLKSRLAHATDAMFSRSELINGWYYFLSTFAFGDVHKAEAACQLVGGHLAEIGNMTEHKEVKDFLMTLTLPTNVLLGLSDEAVEGQWVYFNSGTPATSVDWAAEKPTTSALNCAVVTTATWIYQDYACSSKDDVAFLCQSR